jgi:hypothetical protein
MAHCRMCLKAVTATALLLSANACRTVTTANDPNAQLTTLKVAVAPAVDSAGFFIALYDGLFRAQGLSVHVIPAVSSKTEIDQQIEPVKGGMRCVTHGPDRNAGGLPVTGTTGEEACIMRIAWT